jgi:hypothetical protein
MGHYRSEVPPERAVEIRAALEAADVASFTDPEPSPPTTPFVFVAEGRVGSRPAERRAFPIDALPEGLVPVFGAFSDLATELMDHPHRAIRGTARPVTNTFKPGQELAFDLRLENIGLAPLKLRNPAGARTAAEVGLALDLRGEGVDEGPGPGLRLSFGPTDVRPGGVGALEPSIPAPSEVELEPGEALGLRFGKRVLVSPGRYTAELLYRSYLERPDVQRSALGDLTVNAGSFHFGGAVVR